MNDILLTADSTTPMVFSTDGEVSQFTEEPTVKEKRKLIEFSLLPVVSAVLFGVLYILPYLEDYPTAHTCFAILIVVSFLWGTEGIPSYSTSYLVPILCVWFNIGLDSDTKLRMETAKLASIMAWKFMDPIIFVFLGSFTISACLAKLNITDRVSSFVFKRLSKKPMWILLSLMMLNMVVAAFLSNIASTTLLLTFSLPIIRSLDPDDPFIKAILLGLAWSGNTGGMCTPIASTQNILAVKAMKEENITVSFPIWMVLGFSVACVINLAEWFYLVLIYKPQKALIKIPDPDESTIEPWSLKHTYAIIITVFTIFLWTMQESFPNVLGNVGISALIPVICFFGSGIMDITDFHSIRWSTLALMGGGLALGEAMKLSGLLDLVHEIAPYISKIPLWPLLFIFLVFAAILGSLINSTSAASILYPVISTLSQPTGHSTLCVLLSALMISGSQLFHISSFANALMNGVCRHIIGCPDQITQEPFVSGTEFFLKGWPTMIIGPLIIASFGYGVCLGLGF